VPSTEPQVPVRVWLPWLVGLAAIWGCSFLFISVGIRELHPTYVTLGRVASGALVVWLLMRLKGERLPRDPVTWAHLAVPGSLIALAFTLFGYGERHVPSLLAGIWNGTTPLFTLPVAVLLLRTEKFTAAKTVGLVVGFAGTLVVLGAWQGAGGASLTGQLLCAIAAACYGVAIPYQQRHLTARLDSDLAVSAGQLICATLLMAVVAPLVAGAPPTHLSPKVIGSVLTLGAVGTGIALAIHARNIRWVGGSTASYVTYLSPMFAIAVGILVLGESLHWYQPVGGAVILLGVAIAQGRIRLGPRPTPVVAA
jgi:drug/metabolite transporter (DMT)-like permease